MAIKRHALLICAVSIASITPAASAQAQTPDEKLLYSVKEKVGGIDEALKAGANPNAKFPDGTSVLEFFLRKDPFNMGIHSDLYLLLKSGASVEGLNENDRVRLYHFILRMSIHFAGDHIAVTRRDDKDHPELGKQFLEKLKPYNLNINSQDLEGNTPLMLAVVTPTEAEYFASLLKKGANPNLRNKKNQTALDIFRESAKSFRESSAEDGGFEGAAEYFAENEKKMKAAEQILIQATRPSTDRHGIFIGKVFSVEGKKIQIIGEGISKLTKGQTIIIKNREGNIRATVTETLHSKARAKITGKGTADKGDAVHLAK